MALYGCHRLGLGDLAGSWRTWSWRASASARPTCQFSSMVINVKAQIKMAASVGIFVVAALRREFKSTAKKSTVGGTGKSAAVEPMSVRNRLQIECGSTEYGVSAFSNLRVASDFWSSKQNHRKNHHTEVQDERRGQMQYLRSVRLASKRRTPTAVSRTTVADSSPMHG